MVGRAEEPQAQRTSVRDPLKGQESTAQDVAREKRSKRVL